jgi:hypothetical protein
MVLCVCPLAARGAKGKKSTPSIWLGGTGEVSMIREPKKEGAPIVEEHL